MNPFLPERAAGTPPFRDGPATRCSVSWGQIRYRVLSCPSDVCRSQETLFCFHNLTYIGGLISLTL